MQNILQFFQVSKCLILVIPFIFSCSGNVQVLIVKNPQRKIISFQTQTQRSAPIAACGVSEGLTNLLDVAAWEIAQSLHGESYAYKNVCIFQPQVEPFVSSIYFLLFLNNACIEITIHFRYCNLQYYQYQNVDIQVTNDSCLSSVPVDFSGAIKVCYAPYQVMYVFFQNNYLDFEILMFQT